MEAPSVNLPKGGGAIRGVGETFAADPASGAGTMRVPIACSPGRTGFGPALVLGYDSGAGNGEFGYGWHLALPHIARRTDRGLPRYRDAEESDVFVLSASEDLVPMLMPDGTRHRDTTSTPDYLIERYRPRIEATFAHIERWTRTSDGDVHWRTMSGDNLLTIFGLAENARIVDPDDHRRIFNWLISETRDDRGNAIVYEYRAEDGAGVDLAQAHEQNRTQRTTARYIKRIRYGNRAPLLDDEGRRPSFLSAAMRDAAHWLFEVVFDYGEHDTDVPRPGDAGEWFCRNDPFSSYRAGWEVRTYRLCQRVLMFHHFPDEANVGADCLVRSTDFSYRDTRGDGHDRTHGHPRGSFLASITHNGYIRAGNGYTKQSLPPVEFRYSEAVVHDDIRELDLGSLANLPVGLDNLQYRWVDLDGEGIAGILSEHEQAWYYKPNLGDGQFGAIRRVASLPSTAALGEGQQLLDLAGDGQLDLVTFHQPTSGFYERTADHAWERFRPFVSQPNLRWDDPNLRFVDLDGDGHADLLITEHDVLTWYPSLAEGGFGPPQQVPQPFDDAREPRLVFADGTQSLYLADMSGDGQFDLVRIRNGDICYWPSLGYGRFGTKTIMDDAPWFDHPDQFDQRRVRLVDIDGSGTTDIVYIGRTEVSLYANQSGNRWGTPYRLRPFPHNHDPGAIMAVDLFGNGTACLVWSSSLPRDAARPLRYVDLMGGTKPHLLTGMINNLGAETRVRYASSTAFALADKRAGTPWVTRLPFPVQVVAEVQTLDHISGTRFASRFRYHHGYFDGVEREFRGFAMVEQSDAEEWSDYVAGVGSFGGQQETDPALFQPPVTTRTWFHTGAFLDHQRILHQLRDDYYAGAQPLPEPTVPSGMSAEELRECLRALKSLPLRQEVYSFDGSTGEQHPYTVYENTYNVSLVQDRANQKHAVFFVHGSEALFHNFERDPADPRVVHTLHLDVDDWGNVRRSASVVYGRATVDAALPAATTRAQQQRSITYSEVDFTDPIDQIAPVPSYRLHAPYSQRSYEITGVSPNGAVFGLAELRDRIAAADPIDYEQIADGFIAQRRLLGETRTLFRGDNLAPLPLGEWDTRGLQYEGYQLAFTPGVVAAHYGTKIADSTWTAAGYVHLGDANWWIPSGKALYGPNPASHFFIPVGTRDALGVETVATYDQYDLLTERVAVTGATWNVVSAANDYRVLSATTMTDPNNNRAAVEIDALGMVTKSAIMGKAGANEGDTLADPSARMEYNLFNWMITGKPNFVHTFVREQHGAANTQWQESYTYSNGSGGVALVKAQTRPGLALRVNPDGTTSEVESDPRWIGNGRTVLNNKGSPVKQYEPYFSTTHEYEDDRVVREIGTTALLFYDPIGRNIRTRFPDGTTSRVEVGPWSDRVFDADDMVMESDWYAARGSPDPATPEPVNDPPRRAAWLAARHANTPGTVHRDVLGRVALAIVDYGGGTTAAVRSERDLTGRLARMFDQRDREVSFTFTAMSGNAIYAISPDIGERWTFADVQGNLVLAWDEHGRTFRTEYDALRRPVSAFVEETGQSPRLLSYTVYGDRHPNAAALNIQGIMHESFDQSGLLRVAAADFRGNPRSVERVLAADILVEPDWSALATQPDYAAIQTAATPMLANETWTVRATYDAINRPTRVELPEGTVMLPAYDKSNTLASLDVVIRGQGAPVPFLKEQHYNAKGQRQRARLGNDVTTQYFYNADTFRIERLLSFRAGDDPATNSLQDLRYTYDPVGNIVQIADDAQQTHFFNNAVVKPEYLFEYDAVGQLIKATGREHAATGNNSLRDHRDLAPVAQLPHPNDASAVRTYTEEYEYDLLGNIKTLRHRFRNQAGVGNGWTSRYRYAYEDDPTNRTNRLARTNLPGDPDTGPFSATYDHDDHGNMLRMPHLQQLGWDVLDQLRSVDLGGGGRATYAYTAGGQRVRKLIERQGGQRIERIYLGALEIYRERQGNNAPHLERQTVFIADNTGTIAQIDTKTRDDANSDPANPLNVPLIRYVHPNHLGSTMLETDEAGQVIAYEEYHPWGTTAYRVARSGTGHSLQRYRFSQKERDDETGLFYFGARYYAPWLGRWTSSDPAGFVDGLNLFRYCGNNPVMIKDPSGLQGNPGLVAASPQTERLRNPAMEAEARAYLEGVYTSRLLPQYANKQFVIDQLHFDRRTRTWRIDRWHLADRDPDPEGVPDGGAQDAAADAAQNTPGTDAGTPPTPDAPPAAEQRSGSNETRGTGSPNGSTTGSPNGSANGSANGSTNGSANGSANGRPGGNPNGNPNASGSGGGGGAPEERSFWSRGGRTLLIGLGILALGLLTVATGGGALIMFSAGMAIGAGAATAIGSGVLLTASYTGHTTAEEDRRWQDALGDAALVASSPGSLVGGGIGYAVDGREGMRTGAMIGGLVEGVASLGVAGARAASLKAGPGLTEPVGQVTLGQWRQMTAQQRTLYEWGQLTVRSHVWERIVAQGIEGNPIAKGRFLMQTFGGRFGILRRAWNPFLLRQTWSTGGTPVGLYLGPSLANGARAIMTSGTTYIATE
jgi:RHS repeat-associated protein